MSLDVMKQALAALESNPDATVDCGDGHWDFKHDLAITALRAAIEQAQEPVAWLSRDDARLALWEAINKREFGNPTDDKLILDHLHQQGLWIGKYTAPPQQALTIERLRDALVASRIIPPAAVEDPDEYDDGVTLFRIEALHRRIT